MKKKRFFSMKNNLAEKSVFLVFAMIGLAGKGAMTIALTTVSIMTVSTTTVRTTKWHSELRR
jgi:hypothetical protein